jgi:hypothetical protein
MLPTSQVLPSFRKPQRSISSKKERRSLTPGLLLPQQRTKGYPRGAEFLLPGQYDLGAIQAGDCYRRRGGCPKSPAIPPAEGG